MVIVPLQAHCITRAPDPVISQLATFFPEGCLGKASRFCALAPLPYSHSPQNGPFTRSLRPQPRQVERWFTA